AIRLKPNDADAYENRGVVYYKLNQYQTALDDFSKAISLKNNYVDAYKNRGVVYIMQGNKKLGCRDFKKACALGNCKSLEEAKTSGYCR
ncbi:MAG: tetratricopeptide repeat protein, partial [Smithella sp.]